MSPGQIPENQFGPGWKMLIVASFFMLSMLTWAASPLVKLVEKVQHKETVKAKLNLCSEIRSMIPVYQDWTSKLFINGCLWESRNLLFSFMPNKEKEIRAEFEAQEGLTFEKFHNSCANGAAANQRENKITDRVLTPLYFEKLDCPKVYEEAKKLGIKEDENEPSE